MLRSYDALVAHPKPAPVEAVAVQAEPVFHLRGYGDVTEAEMLRLAAAHPKPAACGICHGEPERCDVHDCGDAHKPAVAAPATADEREAFERHIQATEERKPTLWSTAFANSCSGEQMPAHFEGKYFLNADQKAWLAWQARALRSGAQTAEAEVAQEFYCNKCGYVGPTQYPHNRPCTNIACNYMASPIDRKAGAAQHAEPVADMFWDHDDGERFGHSIDEIINEGFGPGDVVKIDRAMRLPSIKVIVVKDPASDDYLTYEEIAPKAKEQPHDR